MPYRVYEEGDRVKISTMLPTEILALFGQSDLAPVASELESEIKVMTDEAVAE